MNDSGSEHAFHVLIIGGGIGGLCLAQGLRKSGVSAAAYERDASLQSRHQGYRIHINSDGSHALHRCLPEHLFKLLRATSFPDKPSMMVSFDEHLNELQSTPLPLRDGGDVSRAGMAVNRQTLREILLADMRREARFGKAFERFEQLGDGRIRAYFLDGTSAIGNVLVGADGTNSAVRRLVVPDARITSVGQRIYGKTPITEQTRSWLPAPLLDGWPRISGTNGVGMMVGAFVKAGPFDKATAEFAPSVHLTDAPDYLMWTLSPPHGLSLTADEFRKADSKTLHAIAQEAVKDWHPALRRLVAEADVTATFPVMLRTSEPVKSWGTPNVTLLGDAIHTMTPGRGQGANTALRDAELLCQKLVDVAEKRTPLRRAKAEYEKEMLRYGFEAVSDSRNRPFMGPSRFTGR
jgi:2-polyprenyl-6-methoxyphenol hydroxylase-like FAD-dependent oxidoreductase